MARRFKTKLNRDAPPAEETDEEMPDLGPSKSALKAEDHARTDLGVALSELPANRLTALNLPDDLRQAIRDYQSISAHGAKKRQRKFLGRLLRMLDVEPYQKAVDDFARGHQAETRSFHLIERWREELIADDEAVTRWMSEHPGTDAQHLRTVIRSARKHGEEVVFERHSRAYRDLFKLIRRTIEASAEDSD